LSIAFAGICSEPSTTCYTQEEKDETPDLRLETPAVETSLRRWSCQKKEKPDFSGFSANDGADLPAMNVCVWL